MRKLLGSSKVLASMLPMLALTASLTSTGCQVSVGGQTLPSPYYLDDDVQYFPAGPEFKLSNEAAALEARERQAAAERLGEGQATRPGWTTPKWR